jgi:hypothetical protein
MEGGKGPICVGSRRVWKSVGLGPHIHIKGWGLVRELVGGVWFGTISGETNGWFMVCIGDGVEDRFMVVHNKANGRWELRGSMKND